jgi:hypothetical protein
MIAIIFTIIAVPLIIWDGFSLIKKEQRKTQVFYFIVIILTFALVILDSLHIERPGLAEYITKLVKMIFPDVGAS